MVGLIGLPPSEFVKRGENTDQCFDQDGMSFFAFYKVYKIVSNFHETAGPTESLEDVETRLIGEEKKDFLLFIRSMLNWLPEERKTAKELLQDPWLNDEE
jgi:serine/threonine protein kinase